MSGAGRDGDGESKGARDFLAAAWPDLLPPGTTSRSRRLAHTAVPALAVLGTLLLGASAAIELSNTSPRTELWIGMAAGATFLVAMAASRGSDLEVLSIRARLLVGAGLSALLAVSALWQATERAAPRVLLLLIPVCLLFTTAGLALREAANQRRRARLRELRSRQAGEEAERRRWVRELHDETLQELAVVHLLLGTATAGGDPAAQAKGISDARDAVGRQIQALRRLISRMRPLALDSLGLTAALEDLARHAAEGSGIPIDVLAEQLPRLPAETEACVYRIVQEALTNAIRHSGAEHITILARQQSPYLDVSVRDDGCGLRAGVVPGHGLLGMHERAESIGARLTITRAEPQGTLVDLQVPHPVANNRHRGR